MSLCAVELNDKADKVSLLNTKLFLTRDEPVSFKRLWKKVKISVGWCAMKCQRWTSWRNATYEAMCTDNEPAFFGPSFFEDKLKIVNN